MNLQKLKSKAKITSVIALSVLVGTGAGLYAHVVKANAQAPASNSSDTTQSVTAAAFHSNEEKTHETNESADKEALEDSGKFKHEANDADNVNEQNEGPDQEVNDGGTASPTASPATTQ